MPVNSASDSASDSEVSGPVARIMGLPRDVGAGISWISCLFDLDQGMGLDDFCDSGGKFFPIHRQSFSCRHLRLIGYSYNQRVAAMHLLFQQPDGRCLIV